VSFRTPGVRELRHIAAGPMNVSTSERAPVVSWTHIVATAEREQWTGIEGGTIRTSMRRDAVSDHGVLHSPGYQTAVRKEPCGGRTGGHMILGAATVAHELGWSFFS